MRIFAKAIVMLVTIVLTMSFFKLYPTVQADDSAKNAVASASVTINADK